MIIGLVAGGSISLAMSVAETLPVWALLTPLQGLFSPLIASAATRWSPT